MKSPMQGVRWWGVLFVVMLTACGGGGSGSSNSSSDTDDQVADNGLGDDGAGDNDNGDDTDEDVNDNGDDEGNGGGSGASGPLVLTATPDAMQMHLSWSGSDAIDLRYSSDPDCDWDNPGVCADYDMIEQAQGGALTLGAVNDDFDPDTGWYFVAEANGERTAQVGARPAPPYVGGSPRHIAVGEQLYVGGGFGRIGPLTGGGAPVTLGAGDLVGSVPFIDGAVHTAVADAAGGWYIGGDFERVGGLARANLARIRADGRVDPSWSPIADDVVRALAVSGDHVYIGGEFSMLDAAPRSGLARVDASFGDVDSWNPGADDVVRVLLADGDRLFIGGDFVNVAGEARTRLAVFDTESGMLDEDWVLAANGSVRALAVTADRLYMGGDFTEIDDPTMPAAEPRAHLAAVARTTGSLDIDWDTAANGPVFALAAGHGRIYVGGNFELLAGASRLRLGAVDPVSGAVDSDWSPRAPLGFGEGIRSLAVTNGAVVAGGGFRVVGARQRDNVAAFDVTTGALWVDWDPGTDGEVLTLAIADDRVFMGGDFGIAGGLPRQQLAALDPETGIFDRDWRAGIVSGAIDSMAHGEDRLYVGGNFLGVGNTYDEALARNRLAVFHTESGEVDEDWGTLRILGNSFLDLTVGAGRLYGVPAGQTRVENYMTSFPVFNAVTGDLDFAFDDEVINPSRLAFGSDQLHVTDGNSLLGLDPITGAIRWDVEDLSATVWDLQVHDDQVYLFGSVSEVNGVARAGLAVFDTADGKLDEHWEPAFNDTVRSTAITGERLFVGGAFTTADEEDQPFLAAFDRSTSAFVSDWRPEIEKTVSGLAVHGDTVFVVGATELGGERVRRSLIALDAETGEVRW